MASSLTLLTLPLLAVATSQVGAGVQLPNDVVIKGHASKWQPTVSEYLGIPYAQPPVGPLRFKAPQKYQANSTTFVADKFSPDCPANANPVSEDMFSAPKGVVFASLGQFGDSFSEDCLTMNVWTKPQSGEKAKAVMAWIYGGGFALGNSASPAYNGARLAAEKDVVVVSFNYRLNILGFPGAPGLPDQNLGLLDQRLAVEWIRDNIAPFGGDPKRITLFGESAGGASVDYYSYAWTKDPIVNGFIAQSGTVGLAIPSPANTSAGWSNAAAKVGCGGLDAGEKTVDCMRTKPWKQILAAIKPEGNAARMGGMGDFGPIPDDKIVFKDFKKRTADGNFIKRPVLVGNNANEMALFTVMMNAPAPKGVGSTMANGVFGCPSSQSAKGRTDNKVKAWRYLYAGDWPNQALTNDSGAWHGAEIGMAFGSTEYQQQFYAQMTGKNISFPDTPEQKKLMETMMNAWTGFAKDPDMGLEKMGWPVYDPAKPTLIQLGGPNSSAVDFIAPSKVDTGCSLMAMISPSGGGSGGLSSLLSPGGGSAKGAGGLGSLLGLLSAKGGGLGPKSPTASDSAAPVTAPSVSLPGVGPAAPASPKASTPAAAPAVAPAAAAPASPPAAAPPTVPAAGMAKKSPRS